MGRKLLMGITKISSRKVNLLTKTKFLWEENCLWE